MNSEYIRGLLKALNLIYGSKSVRNAELIIMNEIDYGEEEENG